MDDVAKRLDPAFLKSRPSLYLRILTIVRDRSVAEELTQEVYVRAHKAFQTNAPERIEPFLWTTARNLAFDHLRRKKVRSNTVRESDMEGELGEIEDKTVSVEERLIQQERIHLLREALGRLPSRVQKVWYLSRVEGWPYPRIAKHLEISPNTVFNDIKIAMAALYNLRKTLDR